MNFPTVARGCRRAVLTAMIGLGLALSSGTPMAATITLFDWAFNLDGTVYAPPGALPGSFNTAGFDFSTGLGAITLTINTPGIHRVIGFFDHEIDEAINTFFNEFGVVSGVPAAGQSWEIDEPGFVFGDIYANMIAGALDNTNGVPGGAPDDVSMAQGWNLVLAGGEEALVRFSLSDTAPTGGFYLTQVDPDSGASIYFTSSLTIRGQGQIPEPASLVLVGLGLLLLAGGRRSRKLA